MGEDGQAVSCSDEENKTTRRRCGVGKVAEAEVRRKRGGGFLFGAIIGIITGLLLAPRSGKEMRSQLFGSKDELGGQVDRLKGALEAGKESATQQSEALKRKIESTRDRLKHQMEDEGDEAQAFGDEVPPEQAEVI
jgi:gas vesicle protein